MKSFEFKPNMRVRRESDGQEFELIVPIDMVRVIVRNIDTGEAINHALAELTPVVETEKILKSQKPDLAAIDDEDWNIARQRFEVIAPLLNPAEPDQPSDTRTRVKLVAQQHELGEATVWRWLKAWREQSTLSSLIPQKRGNPSGSDNLPDAVSSIITATINELYLDSQKRSVSSICREVDRLCKRAGLPVPHHNTVRKRIKRLPIYTVTKRRFSKSETRNKFEPTVKSFPGAETPLAVYQIDHTPADVILVDEVSRKPVGKPWLTVAIDVFSRMVAGIYVSFDAPSATSVGMCLAHAILPKDQWLQARNIEGVWPVWGKPAMVHADNAKDFRCAMVQRACEQYNIDLTWRPVARPNFGGHIERLLGTFNQQIHELPGSTFSSVDKRGDYQSEKRSSLTLKEFEEWLGTLIVNVYHETPHSTLMTTPSKKFELGIFGDENSPGSGLPLKVEDGHRLHLDFLPYSERTVQRYGIVWDEIYYYHDLLRRWIHEPCPDAPNRKRKFLLRRDPRDISKLFFWDDEMQQYFAIPYRNISHPVITLSELRKVKRKLKEEGLKDIDEDKIFTAYEKMQAISQKAQKDTMAVRRQAARKKHGKKAAAAIQPEPEKTTRKKVSFNQAGDDLFSEEIKPFDDIDKSYKENEWQKAEDLMND